MENLHWNHWMRKIDGFSKSEIETEISNINKDSMIPYVEKNLKLGYLYYSKDFIGTATNIFKDLAATISNQSSNFDFIKENEKGLNIMYMGWRIVPDGCGGFDIFESDCCGDSCGPICGCIGIAAVMAICGISADDVCSFDASSGESGGCIGNGLTGCCNGCADCYGCDTEFT